MTKNQHRRLIINYRSKTGNKYLTDIDMGKDITRRIYFNGGYSIIDDDVTFKGDDLEGEHLDYTPYKKK
jgi:hypothetical protein